MHMHSIGQTKNSSFGLQHRESQHKQANASFVCVLPYQKDTQHMLSALRSWPPSRIQACRHSHNLEKNGLTQYHTTAVKIQSIHCCLQCWWHKFLPHIRLPTLLCEQVLVMGTVKKTQNLKIKLLNTCTQLAMHTAMYYSVRINQSTNPHGLASHAHHCNAL